MDRNQNICKERVIVEAAAAFSCEGDFGGIVFEDTESHSRTTAIFSTE